MSNGLENGSQKSARPRRDGRRNRRRIGEVGQSDGGAKRGQVPQQELLGHGVDVARGDQVSAAGKEMEKRRADGRHSGPGRDRILGPFQVGELQLQAAHGRVAVTSVEVVRRARAPGLNAGVRAERKGGVLVDRHPMSAGRGIGRLAGVDAARTHAEGRGHAAASLFAGASRDGSASAIRGAPRVSYMREATTRPESKVRPAIAPIAQRSPRRSATMPASSAPTA